jgi:hypothetical protein
MVAAFNWEDEPVAVQVPLGEQPSMVFDAWSRGNLGEYRSSISLDVSAHGCRLLAVRPVGEQGTVDESGMPQLFRWSRIAGQS